HVADAASVIQPGTRADESARDQGATLYLPEGAITMLDQHVTDYLALGLQEISPALSFGVELSDDGDIQLAEICRSLIRVERLSYKDAHEKLDEEPLKGLYQRLQNYQRRRMEQGCIDLSLPEVKIHADRELGVSVKKISTYDSQILVRNAMILAGEAAAWFAQKHAIAFPYTMQLSPDTSASPPEDLAGMYGFVRKMRPSEIRMTPDTHAGLGVPYYSRVTSPLRRYLDLLAHQQLRSYLKGEKLIDGEDLAFRAAAAAESARRAQQMERAANVHWKLVFLSEHPEWKGEAVVISLRKQGAQAVIPELAFEIELPGVKDVSLNDVFRVEIQSVDIPYSRAFFRIIS
nr:RNB domain-containing ribonuclease [Spirochaetales bacterium]